MVNMILTWRSYYLGVAVDHGLVLAIDGHYLFVPLHLRLLLPVLLEGIGDARACDEARLSLTVRDNLLYINWHITLLLCVEVGLGQHGFLRVYRPVDYHPTKVDLIETYSRTA